ncbi:MAG: hypothetical protein ACRD2U_10330 [Terriglobales bacterium]
MKGTNIILAIAAFTFAASAQTPGAKTALSPLSPEFCKAAIKYLVVLENFEYSAIQTSIGHAEEKLDSSREDVEAAASAEPLSSENLTLVGLEETGLGHVLNVKIYYLSEGKERADLAKDEACITAWRQALQKQDSKEPDVCNAKVEVREKQK